MSFKENSKFVLLQNENDSVGNETDEYHYKGGIKFQTNKIGGSNNIENNEYREHENKVVPFSLAFQYSSENERYQGGYNDIQVLPEELHNKLFFSIANEIKSTIKNKRKTLKKKID
jgi:hypothetical protein